MQALLAAAPTVLLPVYSGKAGAWAVCEILEGVAGRRTCVIHHWHKHKQEALDKLEQDLAKNLSISMPRRHVYQMRAPHSHVIVLQVVMRHLMQADMLVSGGGNVPCDAVFAAAHQSLGRSLETIVVAARALAMTDVLGLAKVDGTVSEVLTSVLGMPAALLRPSPSERSFDAAASSGTSASHPVTPTGALGTAGAAQAAHLEAPSSVPRAKPLVKRAHMDMSLGTSASPRPAAAPAILPSTATGSDSGTQKARRVWPRSNQLDVLVSSTEASSAISGLKDAQEQDASSSMLPRDSGAAPLLSPPAAPPMQRSSFLFARRTAAHDDKPRPFVNLGLSCYINAGVMACFGVPSFREVLYNVYETRRKRLDMSLLPAATNPSIGARPVILEVANPHTTDEERLAVTFKAAFEPPAGKAMLPRLFTNRLYKRSQEDVMEMLLDSVLNQSQAPSLGQVCAGFDAPKLVCPQCAWQRDAFPEAFTTLSLPVRTEDGTYVCSVQDALNCYFEPEPVSVDWCCQNEDCPLHNVIDCKPLKHHRISIHPQVLVLSLKRWQREVRRDGSVRAEALLHAVTPERCVQVQGMNYELKSVICHIGDSLDSGHYTCFINFPAAGGAWWYYNDTERRLATEHELATSCRQKSYVLFYEKVNDAGPSLPVSVSGAGASSGNWSSKPSGSSLGNIAPVQPPHVSTSIASSLGSSSSSGSARTRCPRRALRRSYTMYPADGLADDLPAPRMGPSVPLLVSSLVPGHALPEPTAAASSSEVMERPSTDLVVPMDVTRGDGNIAQQLADMHLGPQSASMTSPQRRSQPPPVPQRPRVTPRATRLPLPGRPRTRASSARGN